MIIQNILNFIADVIANVLSLVPPPPAAMLDAIDTLQDGAFYLESIVGPLAPIAPFAALNGQLAIWVILGVAYVGLLPFRIAFTTMLFRPAAV